jgi:hypothetical protein
MKQEGIQKSHFARQLFGLRRVVSDNTSKSLFTSFIRECFYLFIIGAAAEFGSVVLFKNTTGSTGHGN